MFSYRVILLFVLLSLALSNIFEYDVVDADGKTMSLSAYKDAKAILIGNNMNSINELIILE